VSFLKKSQNKLINIVNSLAYQRFEIDPCESFEIISLYYPIIRVLYASIMELAFKSSGAMKLAIENNYEMIPMIRKVYRKEAFIFLSFIKSFISPFDLVK